MGFLSFHVHIQPYARTGSAGDSVLFSGLYAGGNIRQQDKYGAGFSPAYQLLPDDLLSALLVMMIAAVNMVLLNLLMSAAFRKGMV